MNSDSYESQFVSGKSVGPSIKDIKTNSRDPASFSYQITSPLQQTPSN